jgi:aryl-alcohol dehydrogenase-like predicted oxidoreductase
VGHYLEYRDGAFVISDAGIVWLKEVFPEGGHEPVVEKVAALSAVALELGITPARLALAWVLKNPNVTTAILGASSTGHLTENLKVSSDAALLTGDILEKIEEIFQTKPKPEDIF